jgi:hypothetical protein
VALLVKATSNVGFELPHLREEGCRDSI